MESSQHLPSESFSHGWLLNIKPPSMDAHSDNFETGSFIEIDPNLISMRFSHDDHGFVFSLPSSEQLPVIVPATQIISGGVVVPLQPENNFSHSSFGHSLSENSSKPLLSLKNITSRNSKLKLSILWGCTKIPKKTFCKYLCFLFPFCSKVRCLRLTPPTISARIHSNAYTPPMIDIRSESIKEAVLYCKNSTRANDEHL
ncbi:uncharacterized protein LOC120260142 [Dioscorea cayenensis subsp. rotundata]|uniref:Uncharacterized protein LOC120260142 n=1 Tax=Dioscorea cayennensis subsp. rotundata TaxID=55577 RepID=A0AB40B8G5_DIOCR|nr:uncharacterized protein LOC120260142 [Dioscorea cayenensis subsp. rotundata]